MDKSSEMLFKVLKAIAVIVIFFFMCNFVSTCSETASLSMKKELEQEKKATIEKNKFANVPALNANIVTNKFKQWMKEHNYITDKIEILDVSAVDQQAIYVTGIAGAVVQEVKIIVRVWGTDNGREDTQYEHEDKYIIEFNMKRTLSSMSDLIPGVVVTNNKPSDWDVAGMLNIVEFSD